MIVEFPPVEQADPQSGLLAVGGDLEVVSLELAYRNGIFPWPLDDRSLLWFAPPQRAIIEFSQFHIPRRLARYLKRTQFTFKVDCDCEAIIKACSNYRNRKGQRGTWITKTMISSYAEFHRAGYVHSFEAYNQSGQLVGGMYGVLIGKYFAGESMFHHADHASKFALIEAVGYLSDLGLTWMDVQVMSPLLAGFGACEIPRTVFMEKLAVALN